MEETTVVTRARQLLTKLGINSVPVDVIAIAQSEGFEVKESDHLGDGEAGSMVKKAGRKIILLNSKDRLYRQRFTVLHEIGHHVLGLPSVHGSHLASNELERYRSRPAEEISCDIFAAECLVPWEHIQRLTDENDFSVAMLVKLSDQFMASKACIASRFARTSSELLAFVPSEDGVIKNAFVSKGLREAGIWIQRGIKVPQRSAAATALHEGQDVVTAEVDGSDWSSSDAATRFSVYEEAVYFSEWDQVLSLLTFEEARQVPQATRFASSEDDELLPELTGILPWR
jgi:hypothetical protein